MRSYREEGAPFTLDCEWGVDSMNPEEFIATFFRAGEYFVILTRNECLVWRRRLVLFR